MRSILILLFLFLKLNFIQAQDCVFFLQREPLPEPIKNYKVFEYSPITKKEELVLTVTFDSVNRTLKKTYHKEFYVWADGYQDSGIGMTWFDNKNNPIKTINFRNGHTDDGPYNYWEYYLYQYDSLGNLVITEDPNTQYLPLTIQYNDSLLLGHLEKEYVYQSPPNCKCYYQYDNLGRVNLIRNYLLDGDSILNKFTYDSKNRVIKNEIIKKTFLEEEVIFTYVDGFRISNYFTYSYENGKQTKFDERAVFKVKINNNKLLYQSYSLEGEIINETEYKYNESGDIVECIQFEENKVLKRILKYKY